MDEHLFKDKKVLVMGLGQVWGRGGCCEVRLRGGGEGYRYGFGKAGGVSRINQRNSEGLDVEYHLGSHEPADFEQADIVVVNPAVPFDNKFVQIARKAGRKVTSQIELFFELCPATIIGITGANGKSTTTSLTAHLLRSRFGNKVWLCGNIGNEPMLTILDQIKPDDLVVLEISSFQIEQLAQSKQAPQVAVLTNLTPNHLGPLWDIRELLQSQGADFSVSKTR